MPTAGELLTIARSQLGYHEGASSSKYGVWYGSGFADASWCDMFVSWCAAQCDEATIIGKFAYTPWHAAWFKARGQWAQTPKAGAIVFYDWGGSRTIANIDHVGICESVRSTSIVAIEGNTDDAVRRRVRSLSYVVGFGYPAYTATPVPAPKPVPNDWTMVIVDALPTLKRGASGTHVRTVQGLLCARGPDVVIDGDFGSATQARVKSEQTEHHLSATGVVDEHTWAVLITGKDFS